MNHNEFTLETNMFLFGILTSISFWAYMLIFRNPTKSTGNEYIDTDDEDSERMHELDEIEYNKYRDLPFYPMFIHSHNHYIDSESEKCSDYCDEPASLSSRMVELEKTMEHTKKLQNVKIRGMKAMIYRNKNEVIRKLKRYVDKKIEEANLSL